MDLLAAIRALHAAACLTLLAVPVFSIWILPPARSPDRVEAILRARFLRILRWSGVVALLSGIAGFALLASSLSAVTGVAFFPLLSATHFGHLFLLRLGFLAVFLVVAWAAPNCWLLLAWSLAILGSLAWAGHAAASSAAFPGLGIDLIHLLAAGVWPGGLLPLALYLGAILRSPAAVDREGASAVVRRFSACSLLAVFILAVSGIGNACLTIGSLRALLSTTYGHLLLVKLLIFGGMLALAATNLVFLTPGIRSDSGKSLSAIRRNVLLELSLGIGVVLVVGILGMTAPK